MDLLSLPSDVIGNLLSDFLNKAEDQPDINKDYLMSGAGKLKKKEETFDEQLERKKRIAQMIREYEIIVPKNVELKSSGIFLNKKMLRSYLLGNNQYTYPLLTPL